jgi:hypothetical protein
MGSEFSDSKFDARSVARSEESTGNATSFARDYDRIKQSQHAKTEEQSDSQAPRSKQPPSDELPGVLPKIAVPPEGASPTSAEEPGSDLTRKLHAAVNDKDAPKPEVTFSMDTTFEDLVLSQGSHSKYRGIGIPGGIVAGAIASGFTLLPPGSGARAQIKLLNGLGGGLGGAVKGGFAAALAGEFDHSMDKWAGGTEACPTALKPNPIELAGLGIVGGYSGNFKARAGIASAVWLGARVYNYFALPKCETENK